MRKSRGYYEKMLHFGCLRIVLPRSHLLIQSVRQFPIDFLPLAGNSTSSSRGQPQNATAKNIPSADDNEFV